MKCFYLEFVKKICNYYYYFYYYVKQWKMGEIRLKLVVGWKSTGRIEGVRNVLKVSELIHGVKERAYQESLCGKYEVCRGGEVESVEEWEKFRDIVMECTWHETFRCAEKKGE